MMSSAARTVAVDAGVMLALKISVRELCLMKLMVSLSDAIKPPSDANDLEKVPMIRSTLSVRPKWDAVPAPLTPITPREWASSTMIVALYFLASFTIAGKFTTVSYTHLRAHET